LLKLLNYYLLEAETTAETNAETEAGVTVTAGILFFNILDIFQPFDYSQQRQKFS